MAKQTEKPKLLFNGVLVNKFSNNPKDALAFILSNIPKIPGIQYWSPDAIKEFIAGTLLTIGDFAREMKTFMVESGTKDRKELAKLSRMMSWAGSIAHDLSLLPIVEEAAEIENSPTSWDRIYDRGIKGITPKKLIQKIYDLTLSAEGLAVLPGFSYSTKQHTTWKA
jgi:hypothetical protein